MSQLLISVRNVCEAQTVASQNIGILDVKEPDHGSLGAAHPRVLSEIANQIDRRLTKSFSAGELLDWVNSIRSNQLAPLADRYGITVMNQYRFIKVGLAGMAKHSDWKRDWRVLFRSLPPDTSAVLVAYFDHDKCDAPAPLKIIEFAAQQKECKTVLFDTFHKSGNLFSHLSEGQLAHLVESTRQNHLTSVVAGSVDRDCLAGVCSARPDFIGVRGAVCRTDRTSEIDQDLVQSFLAALNDKLKSVET